MKNKYKKFVLHIEAWEENNIAYTIGDMKELAEEYGCECEDM